MSLMVLMKAPGLTTQGAFPSNLSQSPQQTGKCLVWASLRAVTHTPGSPSKALLKLGTPKGPWSPLS